MIGLVALFFIISPFVACFFGLKIGKKFAESVKQFQDDLKSAQNPHLQSQEEQLADSVNHETNDVITIETDQQ